jgi:hypothetical protein
VRVRDVAHAAGTARDLVPTARESGTGLEGKALVAVRVVGSGVAADTAGKAPARVSSREAEADTVAAARRKARAKAARTARAARAAVTPRTVMTARIAAGAIAIARSSSIPTATG